MVIIIIIVNVSYYYGKGTPLPRSTHVTAHTQTYVRWYVGQTAITQLVVIETLGPEFYFSIFNHESCKSQSERF